MREPGAESIYMYNNYYSNVNPGGHVVRWFAAHLDYKCMQTAEVLRGKFASLTDKPLHTSQVYITRARPVVVSSRVYLGPIFQVSYCVHRYPFFFFF